MNSFYYYYLKNNISGKKEFYPDKIFILGHLHVCHLTTPQVMREVNPIPDLTVSGRETCTYVEKCSNF